MSGQQVAVVLLIAFFALKIGFLFVLAWNRRYVMDEFVQFGWAKYIPGKIYYLASHHPKAVGYAVFFDLAHLIGWDARSMLLMGRMETALLGCATLAIVYAIARAIGDSRVGGLAIVLILLSFSNFTERIFELRAEPPALFFAAAALLVAVRGDIEKARKVLAAGVLGGLAFLTTQKSLYFDLALGIALVGDAWLRRQWVMGVARGVWLVLGWGLAVAAYCLIFGGTQPGAVAHSLFFGPAAVMSPRIAAEYGGLRAYVLQTLIRNALLYLFCFAGMVMAALRIARLDGPARIALIFTWVIAGLVFAHDQPWPYVFIMALPFMALWALRPLDALGERWRYALAAEVVLAIAVAASFARNVQGLRIDNGPQLTLVAHAEALLGPEDVYFDGIGMLPNRFEPSTLWLDRHTILVTMAEGHNSEAYRIFAQTPPKLIISSYRMNMIQPLVGPLIRDSYVRIAPNLRIAGRRLRRGEPSRFVVPVAGAYALYDEGGKPISAPLFVNGSRAQIPVHLDRGLRIVTVVDSSQSVLLLPVGEYAGRISPGADYAALFDEVYN